MMNDVAGSTCETMRRRVLLADDHPLFRDALVGALRRTQSTLEIEEFEGLEALKSALAAQPSAELVLLDLGLPDGDGFIGLHELRGMYPAIPVVIVSATEDAATIRAAISFGAAGFIPKSSPITDIGAALDEILAGGTWVPAGLDRDVVRAASLSPAQARVLAGLRQGLMNKQMAFDLGVTEATVKMHLTALFRKLGVSNRTQALVIASRLPRPAADARDHQFGKS